MITWLKTNMVAATLGAALLLETAFLGWLWFYQLSGPPAPTPPPIVLPAEVQTDGAPVEVRATTAAAKVYWEVCPTLNYRELDAKTLVVWPKTATPAKHPVMGVVVLNGAPAWAHGTVVVGPPGPGPNPPVPPVPPVPPTPAPIPAPGLRVLMIFDSLKPSALPPAQQAVLFATAAGSVRDHLNAVCVKGPDGKTPEWRVWASDTDVSKAPKLWQDVMARPHPSLPWLVVSNGVSGFEGPLPADTVSVLAVIAKFEGGKQ